MTDTSICTNLAEVGRYWFNGGETDAHEAVGSYSPNAWGLHDMHGNVWEWCLDWWPTDGLVEEETDPAGPLTGKERARRGGSWWDLAHLCRAANSHSYDPWDKNGQIGFRAVIVLPQ